MVYSGHGQALQKVHFSNSISKVKLARASGGGGWTRNENYGSQMQNEKNLLCTHSSDPCIINLHSELNVERRPSWVGFKLRNELNGHADWLRAAALWCCWFFLRRWLIWPLRKKKSLTSDSQAAEGMPSFNEVRKHQTHTEGSVRKDPLGKPSKLTSKWSYTDEKLPATKRISRPIQFYKLLRNLSR